LRWEPPPAISPPLLFTWDSSLTRPVGASFADWFGVSRARGGLALGSGWVSAVLIVVLVAFVARTHIDVPTGTYPSLDSDSAQRPTDPVTERGA
jgi:hypothetical protein